MRRALEARLVGVGRREALRMGPSRRRARQLRLQTPHLLRHRSTYLPLCFWCCYSAHGSAQCIESVQVLGIICERGILPIDHDGGLLIVPMLSGTSAGYS